MINNRPTDKTLFPGVAFAIGFNLAELLISLAILGVIATFTIPKILTSQQNQARNAAAKEVVAMVAESFRLYRENNTLTGATGIKDLTPYMNYLMVDTTSMGDDQPLGAGPTLCGTGNVRCLRLHNGGLLAYSQPSGFSGSTVNHAVWFNFDPDASQSVSGSTVSFLLYANGRISSKGQGDPASLLNGSPVAVGTGYDPPWFQW